MGEKVSKTTEIECEGLPHAPLRMGEALASNPSALHVTPRSPNIIILIYK